MSVGIFTAQVLQDAHLTDIKASKKAIEADKCSRC